MAADLMRIRGGTIYVTSHVCYGCAKLIANSGLARIVVDTEEAANAYRNPLASYLFLRDCGIEVELPRAPLMMARIYAGSAESSDAG
jgi:deoxycytidylate deaminase